VGRKNAGGLLPTGRVTLPVLCKRAAGGSASRASRELGNPGLLRVRDGHAKRGLREGGKERAGMEIQRQQFLNGPLARTFHQRSGSAALKENVH